MSGFAVGVALMLAVRWLSQRLEQRRQGEGDAPEPPMSLLMTTGIDVTIDGLLIGIGFTAGAKTGILLTVALAIEVLFLGVSDAAALGHARASRVQMIAASMGLAALLVVGGAVGGGLLRGLSGAALEVTLSCGSAVLLYLVTEELLVEAHEVPETPWLTTMFFVGFLVLLVIDMVASHSAGGGGSRTRKGASRP